MFLPGCHLVSAINASRAAFWVRARHHRTSPALADAGISVRGLLQGQFAVNAPLCSGRSLTFKYVSGPTYDVLMQGEVDVVVRPSEPGHGTRVASGGRAL